ncbi:hypothetical protein Tco_0400278 [Tanacetum coccineum]
MVLITTPDSFPRLSPPSHVIDAPPPRSLCSIGLTSCHDSDEDEEAVATSYSLPLHHNFILYPTRMMQHHPCLQQSPTSFPLCIALGPREIRHDPERYVGYGITDSGVEIVETYTGSSRVVSMAYTFISWRPWLGCLERLGSSVLDASDLAHGEQQDYSDIDCYADIQGRFTALPGTEGIRWGHAQPELPEDGLAFKAFRKMVPKRATQGQHRGSQQQLAPTAAPQHLMYTKCSHSKLIAIDSKVVSLATLAARMFPEESDKIERYVGGLPDMIHGNIVASKANRPAKRDTSIRNVRRMKNTKASGNQAGGMTGLQPKSDNVVGNAVGQTDNVVAGRLLLKQLRYAYILLIRAPRGRVSYSKIDLKVRLSQLWVRGEGHYGTHCFQGPVLAIMIFQSQNKEEHEEHLKQILELLKKEEFEGFMWIKAMFESIKDWEHLLSIKGYSSRFLVLLDTIEDSLKGFAKIAIPYDQDHPEEGYCLNGAINTRSSFSNFEAKVVAVHQSLHYLKEAKIS